jgi:hypothetical protein
MEGVAYWDYYTDVVVLHLEEAAVLAGYIVAVAVDDEIDVAAEALDDGIADYNHVEAHHHPEIDFDFEKVLFAVELVFSLAS